MRPGDGLAGGGKGARKQIAKIGRQDLAKTETARGKGAILERCVIADGVQIPSGAGFRTCAIIQRDGKIAVTDIK